MNQQETLAKYLKSLRERANLSQKTVSEKLGYSTPQFISNWERGISLPPVPAIEALANLYQVDPSDLFSMIVDLAINQMKDHMTRQFNQNKVSG